MYPASIRARRGRSLCALFLLSSLTATCPISTDGSASTARAESETAGTITLVSQFALPGSSWICDVWGYVDSGTGKEYALVGDFYSGLYIVDVTDPYNPVLASHVPNVPGFDIKTWQHYAYAVDGVGDSLAGIVDLSDPENPVVVGDFYSWHNIYISDDGFLIGEFPGMQIYDLNVNPVVPLHVWTKPDPNLSLASTPVGAETSGPASRAAAETAPSFRTWSLLESLLALGAEPPSPPRFGSGRRDHQVSPPRDRPGHDDDPASHKVGGHDATVIGDILYDFHGNWPTEIFDISNPWSPTLLGTIDDSMVVYHHGGWPTEDGDYLFVADELARGWQPDFYVYDISNPANPLRIATFADSSAIIHNLQVVGDFMFVANYSAGFRVFDVSNPANPVLLDEYDTNNRMYEYYDGAFGVYAFSPSGLVFVSDWDKGLFIFAIELSTPASGRIPVSEPALVLHPNSPNPFNPTTTITFELRRETPVRLQIFDASGRPVRTLLDDAPGPGTHEVVWDGRDDSGRSVVSGVYFFRAKAGGESQSRRMILVK